MIRTTLGAIYKGEFTDGETYQVYVIAAGDIPLYVGKSNNACIL